MNFSSLSGKSPLLTLSFCVLYFVLSVFIMESSFFVVSLSGAF